MSPILEEHLKLRKDISMVKQALRYTIEKDR